MDIKDFQSVTNTIAQNLNNQALVTKLLTELNDDYQEVQTTHQAAALKINDYEAEIKNLQNTNMNLFLKVSQPGQAGATEEPKEPLKYEDVIKDIGGSK